MLTFERMSKNDIKTPVDWSSWNERIIASLLRSWQADKQIHTVYVIENERMILVLQTFWMGYQCSEKEWKDFVTNFGPFTARPQVPLS